MFTTGSKTLIGATVLATVAAIVYGVTQDGVRGTVGLVSAAVALGILATANVIVRDSNVFLDDEAPVETTSAARRRPQNTVWPFVFAFSGVVIVVGLVTFQAIFVAGVALFLASGAEWMVEAWAEDASGDRQYNRSVRSRLAGSLEVPIGGVVIGAIVIYGFSRVMLWVSTKAGTTTMFSIVAALLLVVAFVFASRRKISGAAIGGTVVVGGIAIIAAGTVTGLDGERDIRTFETTTLWMKEANEHPEEYAEGAAAGDHPAGFICESPEKFPEADKKASQTVAIKSNVITMVLQPDGTLDVDVPGPLEEGAEGLTIPRSNPTNFIFKNETDEDRRLSADFGVDDDGFRDMECTPLVEETGSQVLTLTVGQPSFAATGVENGPAGPVDGEYWIFVPGVDEAKVRLLVP